MQLSNEIVEAAEELSASIFNSEMEEALSSETSVLTTTTNSVLSLLTPPWEPQPSPNFKFVFVCFLIHASNIFYPFNSVLVLYLSHNRREMHTEFWYEILKARDNLDALGVDVNIILKRILKK